MRLQSRTLLAGIGLAALLASAVALAACGGGGSGSKSPTAAPSGGSTAAASPTGDAAPAATTQSQASSDEIDACTLISKADVEAAIGTAVLDPKPEQFPNLASCQFGDPGAPVFHLVSVTVVTESSAGDAKSLFDLGKSNANDPQTVDGVGEDARSGLQATQ